MATARLRRGYVDLRGSNIPTLRRGFGAGRFGLQVQGRSPRRGMIDDPLRAREAASVARATRGRLYRCSTAASRRCDGKRVPAEAWRSYQKMDRAGIEFDQEHAVLTDDCLPSRFLSINQTIKADFNLGSILKAGIEHLARRFANRQKRFSPEHGAPNFMFMSAEQPFL